MGYRAGLDWGASTHFVCVIDTDGRTVAAFEARHTAEGIRGMLTRLSKIAPAGELPIAIERPSGLIVDALVEAGFPVVPIHPNVVKACRPRYRAAGAKSDRGDAYMLADILRTDGHRFRVLSPASQDIKALRALVRARDDLVAERVAFANRLSSLLDGFWPGAAGLFADIVSPIALAFLERYPSPEAACRLGEKRMAAFLTQHAYSGRRTASELIARLHAAPDPLTDGAEAQAKAEITRSLVAVIKPLVAEIAKLSGRIERMVENLPDGRIVMSFPRTGRICAAQILAELGDVRERFQTEEQLAAEAGVSPVTVASGKSRSVVFRFACNHRLRTAITCFADNSRHACRWAAAVYQRARARGCDHPHAVRILARAWVKVLWRAWIERAQYDPARHTAALNLQG
jgi:transposase